MIRKLLLSLFLFLAFPLNTVFAEKIDQFNSVITAHQDGTMTVEETISYNFEQADRHGIYRSIPLVSKVGDLYRVIKVEFLDIERDGQNEPFSVDLKSKETEAKIGDKDNLISGKHTYYIKYTVENGIGSNYIDHDEIYWNATGNDWTIPISSASAQISTDFGVGVNRVACFSRSADFNAQFCTFPVKHPFNPITTTSTLQPGDGLTFVASFPLNTFPKSTLQKNEPFADPDFMNFLKFYLPIAGILNLLIAPYLLYSYFQKRSKIRFGQPTVNFDIPKITPAEAGIIDDPNLEKNDVIATIFDLAIRKYLKIEEVKQKKTFAPDKWDYKIKKLKDYDGQNQFEKELFDRLFKGGNEVFLDDLKSDFYVTFTKMEEQVFSALVQKKYYTKNPKLQMHMLSGLAVIGIFTLNIPLGIVLFFLARKLNGRTELGDKTDWEIDGLKIFLKGVSRYQGWQAENLITVEKYIPYAIALGLHDQFMAQLKIVAPNYSPTWYSGRGGFYIGYSGMYSSFSSGVTTSAPSSSSGFSGGSGGGGGGGGGGSW